MSVFIGKGVQTAAAKTILTIVSTAAIRPRVKKLVGTQIGVVSVDSEVEILCSRITTAGTTTAITVAPVDPNDPAATLTMGSNATIEPTYTATTLVAALNFNPRSFFIWQSLQESADIILPATAANGMGALLNTLGGATNVYLEATVQQ